VLLTELGEGLVHLPLAERLGGVAHRHPAVLAQLDRRFDLHHGREGQRSVLLESDLLQVRLLDRLDLGLGQRLPVHVGDEVPGHLLPDVVREVDLDHAPRDLALAEPGELGLPLNTIEGLLPRLPDHVRRLLDLQPPFAGADLLDLDFHASSLTS
jgi:hypothetical protein